MDKVQILDVIMKEWDHNQGKVSILSDQIFKIRGWCIAIFSGILALSVHSQETALILLAVLPVIIFWLFDSMHQGFIMVHRDRIREIEGVLSRKDSTEISEFHAPCTGEKFKDTDRIDGFIRISLWKKVTLALYGSLLIMCLFVFFIMN